MRNYRKYTVLAIACFMLLFSFAESKAEDASREALEYRLMSMLISEEYENEFSLIVIGSETEPWCLGGGLGVLREEWRMLKTETIDALITANTGEVRRLEDSFDLPVEYRLVSEQDYMKTLMGDTGGAESTTLDAGSEGSAGMDAYAAISGATEPDWDSFDEAYPDAQGYLAFSRIDTAWPSAAAGSLWMKDWRATRSTWRCTGAPCSTLPPQAPTRS